MNDLEQITIDRTLTNDEIQRYLYRLVEQLNHKINEEKEEKEKE